MAATATINVNKFPNGRDNTFNHIHLYGTVTINAGTYPANGIPLNFASAHLLSDQTVPFFCEFMTIASGPGVYAYAWDGTNNTFRILAESALNAGSAPFVEFTASSNVPAAVTSDTIAFHAIFVRA